MSRGSGVRRREGRQARIQARPGACSPGSDVERRLRQGLSEVLDDDHMDDFARGHRHACQRREGRHGRPCQRATRPASTGHRLRPVAALRVNGTVIDVWDCKWDQALRRSGGGRHPAGPFREVVHAARVRRRRHTRQRRAHLGGPKRRRFSSDSLARIRVTDRGRFDCSRSRRRCWDGTQNRRDRTARHKRDVPRFIDPGLRIRSVRWVRASLVATVLPARLREYREGVLSATPPAHGISAKTVNLCWAELPSAT